MGKKLRQVTDNIHETIYLSDLESELISTPYFFRLHDIYQSSTVYMTFPSNRTKRYEHSLGTMSLASRMLYSAVTNADSPTRAYLFDKLRNYGLEIANRIVEGDKRERSVYKLTDDNGDLLFDELQSMATLDDSFYLECFRQALSDGDFLNFALDYYQYYPAEGATTGSNIENMFFYRCLLQALRIVALFHDVGHPPYSHIIEHVLSDLYNTVNNDETSNWNSKKVESFKKCLAPFFSKEKDKVYKVNRLFTLPSLENAQAHERIGLRLLNLAIDDVIPEEIRKIVEADKKPQIKLAGILYNIIVVEFAVAILCEKDTTFHSFHAIVDGIVDADRLDYIVRDSKNSGVDWGTIPYERIVNSARLFLKKEDEQGNEYPNDDYPMVIAYPQKISDDIEDLLQVRYKIFSRINFHHRCKKTAMALQASVKAIALDYLQQETDEKCINAEIETLWGALNKKAGNTRIRIIKWNDSWLISTLHTALVNINSNSEFRKTHVKLKENLEEILLNKKRYYSLLKRGADNCSFVQAVLTKANLTASVVEQIEQREVQKYYSSDKATITEKNIFSSPESMALDGLHRLSLICNTYDLELLCKFVFPVFNINSAQFIEGVLKNFPRVEDAVVIENTDKRKRGLPKHENPFDYIYLFDKNESYPFDDSRTLEPQIDAIAKNVPWLYIYFVPDSEEKNPGDLASTLIDLLAEKVAEKLHDCFSNLFPSESI